MTHDQETRLLTLAHDCATLQLELEADRRHTPSGSPDRAQLRYVATHLERAGSHLQLAAERMKR